jgi:hypothetical protein
MGRGAAAGRLGRRPSEVHEVTLPQLIHGSDCPVPTNHRGACYHCERAAEAVLSWAGLRALLGEE